MDRRSWLWRRKSSEKSPGETESSGSLSSFSGRYSDDQEASRASPVTASPNNAQLPDISSKVADDEVEETIKSLNEKLSAALLSVSVKEDLVKQHAKVAEDAVAGWEKAEEEVASLKERLEATAQKNSALEERIGHLDGALKECVRQLRQCKEEQQQKLRETLIMKTSEWESQKLDLETSISELQLKVQEAETTLSINHDFQLKVQDLEKENSALKAELLSVFEDLKVKNLERELSTQAAELASKQHLESIKKVAKLETECRKLRASAKIPSPFKDCKHQNSSVESLTDAQSDSGERLFNVDNEVSCLDSWTSALVTEPDQFQNNKVFIKNLTSSVEIDLMNDFLEMEKLVALPEVKHGSSSFKLDPDAMHSGSRENPSRDEIEALQWKMVELEEKVEKITLEKQEVEMVLTETGNQHKISCYQLRVAEEKLIELQRQLNSINGSNHVLEMEIETVELRKKELESQLESANLEVKKLLRKVRLFEAKLAESASKCQDMEAFIAKNEKLEGQLASAHLEVKELLEKVGLLESKLEEERSLTVKLASKCQDMEAFIAKNEKLEGQLASAHLEVKELLEKVDLLESKLEEERSLTVKLAAKCQSLKALLDEKMDLESKFISAQFEAKELQNKICSLEATHREEQALSAEFAAMVETLEVEREALNAKLNSAYTEAGSLREKIIALQNDVKLQSELASELAAKHQNLETAETKREDLEPQLCSSQVQVEELLENTSLSERKVEEQSPLQSQLELATLEIRKLYEKVSLLEKEIGEERALTAELVAKCQNLKNGMVKNKLEVEPQLSIGSTVDLKMRQKRELAVAGEKFAACQKTIASLNEQLKSLTDFEALMLEAQEPNTDDKENLGSFPLLNQQDRGLLAASPGSFHASGKFLSASLSYTC